jgi:hypothetical protein
VSVEHPNEFRDTVRFPAGMRNKHFGPFFRHLEKTDCFGTVAASVLIVDVGCTHHQVLRGISALAADQSRPSASSATNDASNAGPESTKRKKRISGRCRCGSWKQQDKVRITFTCAEVYVDKI